MSEISIHVNRRGKWSGVPGLDVEGTLVMVRGRWLKVASVHDEEWLEDEVRNPEQCIAELKQPAHKRFADIFTFTQKLPATQPRYEYPMEWESVAAVHLTTVEHWWESLPQATRKSVRRSAKRGVTLSVVPFNDDLVRQICEVNNDSPLRQGVRNTQFGKSLEETRRDYCSFTDRSDFICAYLGGELIGFLKLVYRGGVASVLNLTTKASHYDARPGNAMIAHAMELCHARGISWVTYGLYNYGNKRHSSLREFKVRNGFSEVLVPRYYVPITAVGAAAMKLKLHRGALGILPHGAIIAGVRVRALYYNVGTQISSRCSSMPERPNRNRQMECSTPPAGSNS